MNGITVQIISSFVLPENCMASLCRFLLNRINDHTITAVIAINKKIEIPKITAKALSTPSARFEAPENIFCIFFYLNE